MNHYCTYFDHRYLSRGLALHASMQRHCRPFRLWVLCLTDECYRVLAGLELPDVVPLRLDALEAHDPELLAAKSTRSTIEYYLTCTPSFMSWLLDTRPEIDALTYLDADLFFFQRPDFLFEEYRGFSTLITPHKPKKTERSHAKHGVYNDGWTTFRRDPDGLACVRWWRARCIEWCYDIEEPTRWLEQKYLDEFSVHFSNVKEVRHLGVNVGPWNLADYRLGIQADGSPTVDDQPVIFFHFSGLRYVTPFLWRTTHRELGAPLDRRVRRRLYRPYLEEVNAAERVVQRWLPGRSVVLRSWAQRLVTDTLLMTLREILKLAVRGGGIWMLGSNVL